ncbi:MAG: DUF4827 domain-containing protein [Bacteroidaceae bacterium]|nr:DUF4827 domain-containing protein [Bacteroidaceae bacterium]
MKKYLVLCLAMIVTAIAVVSCGQSATSYAEQKRRESKVVESFLKRDVVLMHRGDTLLHVGKITVISEEDFVNQDSTTDVGLNEYVRFARTGIYMQIVRKGTGSYIGENETRRVSARFWEYNIMGDSLQLSNTNSAYIANPEVMNISNNYGTFSGSYDTSSALGSLIYNMYGSSSVIAGWLAAMPYLRLGRQNSEVGVAKVRLIVPHSQGQLHATTNVYPCFYELVLTGS